MTDSDRRDDRDEPFDAAPTPREEFTRLGVEMVPAELQAVLPEESLSALVAEFEARGLDPAQIQEALADSEVHDELESRLADVQGVDPEAVATDLAAEGEAALTTVQEIDASDATEAIADAIESVDVEAAAAEAEVVGEAVAATTLELLDGL
jgi:hypothetical protein